MSINTILPELNLVGLLCIIGVKKNYITLYCAALDYTTLAINKLYAGFKKT